MIKKAARVESDGFFCFNIGFRYNSSVSHRVVHFELNWMWRVFVAMHFFHFQINVGINLVIGENVAFFQESTSRIELFQLGAQ